MQRAADATPICSGIMKGEKNRLGQRLGIEIGPNCFGKGLQLWHAGGIVVNPNARIGDYCVLHGGACIGNKGKADLTPVIGNHEYIIVLQKAGENAIQWDSPLMVVLSVLTSGKY